jgi:hypothetical protein
MGWLVKFVEVNSFSVVQMSSECCIKPMPMAVAAMFRMRVEQAHESQAKEGIFQDNIADDGVIYQRYMALLLLDTMLEVVFSLGILPEVVEGANLGKIIG